MARIGAILIVLAAPLILQAQEELPDGAIARLGSTRFRHVGWITAIAYSPDGKRIATGCIDGNLRIWDAASGSLAWKSSVGAMVTSVDFSPDGRHVAAGGFRGWGGGGRIGVEILVAGNGNRVWFFSVPAYGVRSLAFSPDGNRLAIGTGIPASPGMQILPDKASFVEIHSLETWARERKLPGHSKAVISLTYSPDGKRLATAGPDGDLRITDVASGKALHEIDRGGHVIDYSPDGKVIAAGSLTGTVRILDPDTGKTIREVSAQESGIRSIAFSPDGRKLAVTSPGLWVSIWDTTSWDPIRTVRIPVRSRLPSSWQTLAYPLAFSPDSKTLAVGSNDHLPHFIDTATGKDLSVPGGHRAFVADLTFSPDSRTLASTGGDGSILLWDTSSHDLVRSIDTGDRPHHALAFSPDGKILAAGGQGDSIRAFRALDGKPLRAWALDHADRKALQGAVVLGTAGPPTVQGIIFAPDGKRIFASASDGWLYDLDAVGDGMEILARAAPDAPGQRAIGLRDTRANLLRMGPWSQAWLETLALRPGGNLLVHRNTAAGVRILGLPGGKALGEMHGDGRAPPISTLGLSPDGGTLVTGIGNGKIHLWEVATEKAIRSVGTGGGPVTSLAISPDGSLLAWAGDGQRIQLWHFGRSRTPFDIPGAGQGILTLAFSPDGKILASAGLDGTITLWDVELISCPTRPFYEGIDEETLEVVWNSLALGDAKLADISMWALAHSPDDSLPFLKERFQPTPEMDTERLRALLEGLDHDDFDVRERATLDLIALGSSVEDDLVAALESDVSPEVQGRLERILSNLRPPFRQFPSEALRRIRTIRTLERMGTAEAEWVLKAYAERSHSEREKRQIRAAIRRMEIPREF